MYTSKWSSQQYRGDGDVRGRFTALNQALRLPRWTGTVINTLSGVFIDVLRQNGTKQDLCHILFHFTIVRLCHSSQNNPQ